MRACLALVLLLTASCADEPSIVVGAKSFAEQRILAHASAVLIEGATRRTATVRDCGDTFSCQQALRSGHIDLMVEYTGTGYLYSGSLDAKGDTSIAGLNKLYEPLGLTWFGELGFENPYRVVMDKTRAVNQGITSIRDLAKLENVRFAVPPTFRRRPNDGFASLVKRHGLRTSGAPMSNADTHERVRALSAGRVDVAIVYATDGALRGRDFAVLSDTLGFFPRYDASFVARTDFGKKHPKAIQALGELKLSQNVMTSLNYRVEVSGQTPNMVARDYLRQTGLSGRIANNVEAKKDELVIAVSQDDSLEWEKQEARRATSLSFPDRRVLAKTHSDPFSAVMNGEARLAIVGAERFFRRTEQGLERDERLEAAAVIGTRTLHIVRRKDDTQGALEGRLGAAPSSSGSGMLSDSVLALAQRKVTDRGDAVPLLKKVNAGTLDAALLWVAPNEEIADMTRSGKIRIAPFSNAEIRLQLPYLRPVEIATGTYANDAGIPTLAAQVVIAARNRMAPKGSSGPSAALKKTSAPLTIAEATALADATETGEAPDPVLPSVWTSGAGAGDQKAQPGSWEAVVDTGLNIAVFAFIAFMGVLLVRREAPR